MDSLRSPESKRGYRHAIDEFIQWYCSEPRLSFNKGVVTGYRIFLENRQLAAGTINGRLAAVRRLAYEAADAGLLSPELAAGIRRVKGARKLGVRLGNWLTTDEARKLWQAPAPDTLKGKRDRAILAILLGCGLRRRELADLEFTHIQQREVLTLWGHGQSKSLSLLPCHFHVMRKPTKISLPTPLGNRQEFYAPVIVGVTSPSRGAGINRHEAGNERVLRERSSEPLGPEFCVLHREV